MYDPRQLLKQEPAAVVAVLAQWLTVLRVTGAIDWSAETIVTIEGAVLGTLMLVYVRPLVHSRNAIEQVAKMQQDNLSKLSALSRVRPIRKPVADV